MKKTSNNFKVICGMLAGFMIGGLTVVGANQTIQALQNTEIKVSLNGVVQEFKDEKTGETQYPITYHDRTYLPLRNVAQLSGINVDYDENGNTAILETKFNLYEQLERLDFSNTLSDRGWEISKDGKMIKCNDFSFTTNLEKNVKSFKVAISDMVYFVVLTEDGEVYFGNEGGLTYFGKGYDGICGICDTTCYGRLFIAKETLSGEAYGDELYSAYTLYNSEESYIRFTNGV